MPHSRDRDGKKAIRCGRGETWWPTPYDVWLSGQMRAKGGIETGVDLGASGAEESGEERVEGRGRMVSTDNLQRGFTAARKT